MKKNFYKPQDISKIRYSKDLADPGHFPFTRGIHSDMYRTKLWTMRQFSGFATAQETNKRLHYLLKTGQTGLSIAFDNPTIMGYDSDHAKSLGEVGRCGVAMDSLQDMEILFRGIRLDQVTTSMTINGPAAAVFALFLACAENQGISIQKLRGTVQNDILKEYIAQKTYCFPPQPSLRIITDMLAFCVKRVPEFHPVSISGYHIREAGATSVQELAFTLADGLTYVQEALKCGLKIDDFAPQLSFFFNAHMNFFEEIAKYRAARKIWAHQMKHVFKAKNPKSWWMRFHAQTAGCSLTEQQPENNIVRTTLEALSAVLGGAQSLHTNSLDETISLPSEWAVQVALRTQQILAYETGIPDVVDPLGGSYYIEALTQKMEDETNAIFKKIKELGGVVKAIELGFFQREIAESALKEQKRIEEGKQTIVGVNRFQETVGWQAPMHRIPSTVEKEQIAKLKKLRKSRSNQKVKRTLEALKRGTKGRQNLMPLLLDAAHAYATLGEMIGTLREIFGEYEEPSIF